MENEPVHRIFTLRRLIALGLLYTTTQAALACTATEPSAGKSRRSERSSAAGSLSGAPSAADSSAGRSALGVLPTTKQSGTGKDQSCARQDVQAGRKQPLVTIVIDGSGSMCAPFGNATRWTALRSALMDPDGIVTRLSPAVLFGVALYDGPFDISGLLAGTGAASAGSAAQNPQCAAAGLQNSTAKACPNLIEVPQALNNDQAIAAVYPMQELGGSTPTHKALEVVVDKLVASQMVIPDQMLKPQYIVLATDGEPNELCPNASGLDPRAEVIRHVTRAADAGIKTFVISLAGNDANLMSHLVAVAQAGMTGSPPFSPMNKQDLVTSLTQIIGGAVGCEVFLNGKVTVGQECGGTVQLNGASLPCDDPNGWSLKDEQTLKLNGQACSAFLNDPLSVLHADFPCGVFVPS